MQNPRSAARFRARGSCAFRRRLAQTDGSGSRVIPGEALLWLAAAVGGRDSRDGRDWRTGASATSRPTREGD